VRRDTSEKNIISFLKRGCRFDVENCRFDEVRGDLEICFDSEEEAKREENNIKNKAPPFDGHKLIVYIQSKHYFKTRCS